MGKWQKDFEDSVKQIMGDGLPNLVGHADLWQAGIAAFAMLNAKYLAAQADALEAIVEELKVIDDRLLSIRREIT